MISDDQDYNRRQYRLMARAIRAYRDGSLGLAQLVNNLEALGEALQGAPAAWLSEYQSAWGMLEDVYASMLDEGEDDLDETDARLVSESLGRLTALVEPNVTEADL